MLIKITESQSHRVCKVHKVLISQNAKCTNPIAYFHIAIPPFRKLIKGLIENIFFHQILKKN